MPHDRKIRKVRRPMRDYSRNLSVRMTEEQHQRLQRFMGLTRLKSTAYFCRLIQGNDFKGCSPKLNHAMHTGVNMIYSNVSNVQQISRHQRTIDMDAEAVAKMVFLMDKLCEEIYLLANQK